MFNLSKMFMSTGVRSLVNYLLHHVAAYACRHQFGQLTFFIEIFDHMINSRRIRRFGPFSNSSNTLVWSISNRKNGPNLRIRIVCDHVASNQLEFTGLVHFFCSKWTKLAYSKSLNMDQTCVFDENWSCDQTFRRKSQWTKLVTACICCHVMEEIVDQTWDPRVSMFPRPLSLEVA